MSYLSWTYGATYLDELWSYVLSPMFGIQYRPHHSMLPLQTTAKLRKLSPFRLHLKSNQPVPLCLSRVLAPRSSEILKYLCRTTDAAEWVKRRQLNNIRAGLIVDFQDAFKIWRRAIILKTFFGKNNKLMVNIKSFFKGTEILETL